MRRFLAVALLPILVGCASVNIKSTFDARSAAKMENCVLMVNAPAKQGKFVEAVEKQLTERLAGKSIKCSIYKDEPSLDGGAMVRFAKANNTEFIIVVRITSMTITNVLWITGVDADVKIYKIGQEQPIWASLINSECGFAGPGSTNRFAEALGESILKKLQEDHFI